MWSRMRGTVLFFEAKGCPRVEKSGKNCSRICHFFTSVQRAYNQSVSSLVLVLRQEFRIICLRWPFSPDICSFYTLSLFCHSVSSSFPSFGIVTQNEYEEYRHAAIQKMQAQTLAGFQNFPARCQTASLRCRLQPLACWVHGRAGQFPPAIFSACWVNRDPLRL